MWLLLQVTMKSCDGCAANRRIRACISSRRSASASTCSTEGGTTRLSYCSTSSISPPTRTIRHLRPYSRVGFSRTWCGRSSRPSLRKCRRPQALLPGTPVTSRPPGGPSPKQKPWPDQRDTDAHTKAIALVFIGKGIPMVRAAGGCPAGSWNRGKLPSIAGCTARPTR